MYRKKNIIVISQPVVEQRRYMYNVIQSISEVVADVTLLPLLL